MKGTLHCTCCGKDFGNQVAFHRCPACENPLSISLPASVFPLEKIAARTPNMWRYAEALPNFSTPISLGEPLTPLVPFKLGELEVLAKCEFTCPTGSYKDRGAALLMSYLKALGVQVAVEDSSGNAGASMAAYAARAGIRLKVFCPAAAAAGKLVQIQLYGAELVRVDGPRPRATEALLDYVASSGAVYASHLWSPLFNEGIKTMAFEIAEQLKWSAPAIVFCPVGAGSILLGLYNGFKELRNAGIIPQLPRLIAVQALHTSPVYQACKNGAERILPLDDPQPTLAEGIALPAPVRDREVLQALRDTGGTAIAVSEEDIIAGVKKFGQTGFCVEPTSAVVWQAIEQLHARDPIPPGSAIVAVLSGHGLKAAQSLGDLLEKPL